MNRIQIVALQIDALDLALFAVIVAFFAVKVFDALDTSASAQTGSQLPL